MVDGCHIEKLGCSLSDVGICREQTPQANKHEIIFAKEFLCDHNPPTLQTNDTIGIGVFFSSAVLILVLVYSTKNVDFKL